MPKVLVSGSGGQLGLELAELLPRRGHEVVALSKGELDVTDFGGVRQLVTITQTKLVGVDVATGALLWERPFASSNSLAIGRRT